MPPGCIIFLLPSLEAEAALVDVDNQGKHAARLALDLTTQNHRAMSPADDRKKDCQKGKSSFFESLHMPFLFRLDHIHFAEQRGIGFFFDNPEQVPVGSQGATILCHHGGGMDTAYHLGP